MVCCFGTRGRAVHRRRPRHGGAFRSLSGEGCMTAKRPWMPLYIADFHADTTHLNAAETGAYLLLIMHYWQRGKLPTDEGQLARIARLSRRDWGRYRATLKAF